MCSQNKPGAPLHAFVGIGRPIKAVELIVEGALEAKHELGSAVSADESESLETRPFEMQCWRGVRAKLQLVRELDHHGLALLALGESHRRHHGSICGACAKKERAGAGLGLLGGTYLPIGLKRG